MIRSFRIPLLLAGLASVVASCNKYAGNLIGVYDKDNWVQPSSLWYGPDAETASQTPLLIALAGDTVVERSNDGAEKRFSIGAFYLSDTEITNQQFAFFLNGFSKENPEGSNAISSFIQLKGEGCEIQFKEGQYLAAEGFEKFPVVQVSALGAQAYCEWMTETHNGWRNDQGLYPLPSYRLPSYYEFMLAQQTGKVWRKEKNKKKTKELTILDMAWVKENSGMKIHEVRTSQPDHNDLYDVEGNLQEWVGDIYGKGGASDGDVNPVYRSEDSCAFVGSYFASSPSTSGMLNYQNVPKSSTFSDVGFRVCITLLGRSSGYEF